MFADPIFMSLLCDRCDIYHIDKVVIGRGYGLPDQDAFIYPETPDEPNVKCHFNICGARLDFYQGEPQANYSAAIQLDFPPGTDIRVNDKIVDKRTGYAYTAEAPRWLPDNHHIIVMIKRREEQEPL